MAQKSQFVIEVRFINWDWIIYGTHTRSSEMIEILEKLNLNTSLFYTINGFDKYKMNRNPVLKNLTILQKRRMFRFISEHLLLFDSGARHMFSLSQLVMRRLIPLNPSTINNKNTLIEIYRHFLMRCSGRFGRLISSQFVLHGRFQQINPYEIIKFATLNSLQKQLLSISHYGYAAFLGNTSAIAEITYRLYRITMYDRCGNIDNPFKIKLLRLIEYGISRRCPDCLGMMSHFLDVGLGIVPVDRQRALELAGQSAEAGSIYGWFALACLLNDNSNHLSNYDKYDDGIYVDEDDLGVRKFVCERATFDEQIRWTLEERGCESCLPQFYDGKDECHYCGFEFDVFNHYPNDDDTSVPKPEQMRIAVKIYYKILSENPSLHPICVDVHRNLIKIYKAREHLFNGSIEATDEEISRLEAI